MFVQNFGGTNKEYYGIFESGVFFFLRRSKQENNLWSLHTNWWSRNFLIVSRWHTGTGIAIKLNTLCQHRTNTFVKKQLFRFTMYHWREGRKHLNSRISTTIAMASRPNRNKLIFVFRRFHRGKNHFPWRQLKTKESILNTILNSQESLVLQRNDKNLTGSNKSTTLECTKNKEWFTKTYLFRWRASLARSLKFRRTLSYLIPLHIWRRHNLIKCMTLKLIDSDSLIAWSKIISFI